jgi:hypothetical protein
MFLHKLDILNRNLNGLLQKFLLLVTKLCSVTKLGDLTVLLRDDQEEIDDDEENAIASHVNTNPAAKSGHTFSPLSYNQGSDYALGFFPVLWIRDDLYSRILIFPSRITYLGSRRVRIPDPDLHQKI